MTLEKLVVIGFILFFSSLIQSTVGFAFGLFAIPLLVWAGLNLSEAVAITSVSILTQVLVATYQLRIYIRWREVMLATLVRYLTVPIGVMILLMLDTLDKDQLKQFVGVMLLLILGAQIFWKVQPQEQLGYKWLILAFSSSGIMQGMVAMGGPPAVLWVMAHRWSSQQTRAFLLTISLLVAPLQIFLLYISAGSHITAALFTGVGFIPVVVIGSIIGVRLGNLVAKAILRQMVLAILLITALLSILSPFLG